MEITANFWIVRDWQFPIGGLLIAFLAIVFVVVFVAKLGSYWLQAYMSGADVSMKSLIEMSLMRVEHRLIVNAKVMGRQAGLPIDRKDGMSTERLLAHHLAGGNVFNVVRAIIASQYAGIDLDFDQAAAIDLAGRDVLLAVQNSVSPKVIRCPHQDSENRKSISAIAKNGVEILVGAMVTVRTNLDQLTGGATEDTIIARVGQGIVSAIGSANSHMDVLEVPSQISKGLLMHGLDLNTVYSIVSIDIANIDIGENVGARLQIAQAESDTRVARAKAEVRRAEAVAEQQQMLSKVAEAQSKLVLAETHIPAALAHAFRAGQLYGRLSKATAQAKRDGVPKQFTTP